MPRGYLCTEGGACLSIDHANLNGILGQTLLARVLLSTYNGIEVRVGLKLESMSGDVHNTPQRPDIHVKSALHLSDQQVSDESGLALRTSIARHFSALCTVQDINLRKLRSVNLQLRTDPKERVDNGSSITLSLWYLSG